MKTERRIFRRTVPNESPEATRNCKQNYEPKTFAVYRERGISISCVQLEVNKLRIRINSASVLSTISFDTSNVTRIAHLKQENT